MEIKEIRIPSFGEQLIGISIDAQTAVVKVLTLKHYTEDEA